MYPNNKSIIEVQTNDISVKQADIPFICQTVISHERTK